MNHRAILKILFLFITFIISCIFLFTKYNIEALRYFIFLIPILIQIILTNKFISKNKKSKLFLIVFIIISLIDIIIISLPFIYTLNEFIRFGSFNLEVEFYYLIIIWITFILSFYDIKKDTNRLNDILTIIVSLIISLVHYRYYIDPKFLHNLINLEGAIVLSNSYNYVSQYYLSFFIMYIVLLIQKIINNITIK